MKDQAERGVQRGNERLSNIETYIDIEIETPAASLSESAIFEMRKIDMRSARGCKKRVNFYVINYSDINRINY